MINTARLQRQFCIKDEQVRTSLPYRLGGIYSEKKETTHRVISEQFASSILKPTAAEGFVQAYEVLTSAIAEEDDVFIRDVCEPVLADKLLAAMSDLKQKGLRLVKSVPASNKRTFSVNYNMVAIHGFQPLDRREQGKATPLVTPIIEMHINMDGLTKGKDVRHKAFIALVVEFDTNVHLKLVNRAAGQDAEDPTSLESLQTHRVEFAIARDDFLKNMDLSGLMSMQMSSKAPAEALGRMFAGENYQWLVYDIDDFMRSKQMMNSN